MRLSTNTPRASLLLFIFFLWLLFIPKFASADTEIKIDSNENIVEQLSAISTDIKELEAKKFTLIQDLKNVSDPTERQELENIAARVNTQLKGYTELFEKISLGGLDIARFETPAKIAIQQVNDYNWQQELVQIAQPVFSEMKKLTDAPRKRDILRLEQKEIAARLDQLNKGLNNLALINTDELPLELQNDLQNVQTHWVNQQKDLEREQKLVLVQLDELTAKEHFTVRLASAAWDFAKGRGLILVVTISVLSLLIYGFNHFLIFIESHEKNLISIKWRIFILLYQIVTTLAAVMITLMILYSSGDMVLFGLAILIILAFLVSSRNSIPKYFTKIRIFLNIGQAREGERIIYNDLPWKISRINLYTVYLVNPLLENGTIRLTIDHLNNMISRPTKMDETWFPTVVNDAVLINGTVYKVRRQTPDYVYLIAANSEIIYPSKDFIKDKIPNLTYGYYNSTEFAFVYVDMPKDIDAMIAIFKDQLNAYLLEKTPDAHKCIKSLIVDFNRLNLDGTAVFLVAVMMGSFATDYRSSIIRTMQKGAIYISQQQGWPLTTIPTLLMEQVKPKSE